MKVIIEPIELDDMLTKYYNRDLEVIEIAYEPKLYDVLWFSLDDGRNLNIKTMDVVLSSWYDCAAHIEAFTYSATGTHSIVVVLDKGANNDLLL